MAAAEFLPWFEEDRARGFGAWMLRQPDGDFVGFSGLTTADEPVGGPDPEFSCLLTSRWHGSGLATEAGRAVIEDGWARMGLARVITVLDSPNPGESAPGRTSSAFGSIALSSTTTAKAYLVFVLDRPESTQVAG